MSTTPSANRRDFLKAAAATSAVLTAGSLLNAHAAGSDEIRVGVVGCGGRGSGAADNVLNSSKGVKVVALADVFKDKVDRLRRGLADRVQRDRIKELGNGVDLPEDRCFVGLDAYEKVINCPEVNYVILATPPGFRPLHIQATIAAGKNLFTEKPVGVDGAGIRKVLAAYEDSLKKGLHIAAGTQRRHQDAYVKMLKMAHDGAIGDIVALRCYWNGQGIWFNKRQPGMTDVAYQLKNWYHFLWVCGDHIVEQHVHNLDVCNWAMNGHPARCDGAGGRTPGNPSRPDGPPEVAGNIWDHFSIDYEYPNGVHMYSSCRHIPSTQNNVSEHLIGSKGTMDLSDKNYYQISGKAVVSRREDREATDPYVQEHTDLIACIRANKPINELKSVAESTLTAIMGRMSAYTGKAVTWEQALSSKEDTYPQNLNWDMSLHTPPVPSPCHKQTA